MFDKLLGLLDLAVVGLLLVYLRRRHLAASLNPDLGRFRPVETWFSRDMT